MCAIWDCDMRLRYATVIYAIAIYATVIYAIAIYATAIYAIAIYAVGCAGVNQMVDGRS